ncbi:MAG: amino-acid N-acetyltransferase [Spirochaetales bacterium]|nr:amino-acid N-acetyltransferase [Spirochaetales bacterium]
MENPNTYEHVELIREVFHYIRRFRNSTFVIKIDSPVINDPGFPVLCSDLALLRESGVRIVIIPGARERIDEILDRFSVEWKIINGTRVTSEEAIPFIKMAAFDVANKVMTSLAAGKVDAVIGNWVRARAIGVIDGTDHISAGTIEKINTTAIRSILDQGMIPIFPCIGWSSLGKPYNVSSDELSSTIAEALKAEKLFFVHRRESLFSELLGKKTPGLVINGDRVSRMDASTAESLELKNPEERRFLDIALHACRAGVERVHFINGNRDGEILREIFSNQGCGTLVHANPYESVRPMTSRDVADVLAIMNPLIEKGKLIGRSREDLMEMYKDYIVFEIDGSIHGCAALHEFSGGIAEIAGLAVDQSYKHLGIGRQMVSYLIEHAALRQYRMVFVFTTQSEDWFQQLGFRPGTKADLPAERTYNEKRNSKILVYSLD